MTEQPSIDWREVQRLYTATMTPAAAICQQQGIVRTALRLRAQREAWARPGPVKKCNLSKNAKPLGQLRLL